MKRFFRWFILTAVFLAPAAVRAQTSLGQVAAVLPINAASLLADPARNRVYAAVTASDSVVVIDTTTFETTATIPVGSEPVDLSISPDDNTLYVANSGSSLGAISVIDLNALTVEQTIALAGAAQTVVAGPSGRVYVELTNSNYLFQVDTATGSTTMPFGSDFYGQASLLAPDGQTLYVTDDDGDLETYDVSAATPALLLSNGPSVGDGVLVISHNNKYFCVPNGSNSGVTYDSTSLYSTANLTSVGSFSSNDSPGPLVFSPDDSLVYQYRSGSSTVLDVFSTKTFAQVQEVPLTAPGSTDSLYSVGSLIMDNTGSYLFLTAAYENNYDYTQSIIALTTGTGPLTPPSLLPSITSSLTANGTEGLPFTYQITASNTPTSYNATDLPTGLSINPSTGLISGTPTYFGTYTAQISATNVSGTGSATLTINIVYDDPDSAPVIVTTSLPDGIVGQAYSATVSALHSPSTYNASGLPAGLSINYLTGVISGTPTTKGTYTVTLSASNDYGSGSATCSLVIESTAALAPVISTASLPAGAVGQTYSFTVTATNAPTYLSATGLPAGLSINHTTGVISGTPTAAGTSTVLLTATNSYGSGSATESLTIASAPATSPPVITSPTAATGVTGTAFTYQIIATNAPTVYSAYGLPASLSLNAATGFISGTPTDVGSYAVTLNASNALGNGSTTLTLTITLPAAKPPMVTTTTLPGTVGVAFSYQVIATNSPTSYTFTGYAGNPLPAGLNFDPATGFISGTPQAAGTFYVSVTATNTGGTGQGLLTLSISAGSTPTITSAATGSAISGQAFDYQIVASNDPTSFNATNLPPGLSIDTATGLITGTPTATGFFNVTLSATNSNGTTSTTLMLTINASLPTIDVVATVPHVSVGSGDHAAITISRSGDLSQKLSVAYSIKGSARNGTDYVTITGRQKLKANKASATIQIIPKDADFGSAPRTLKVTLLPADGYQLGASTKAKVKLLPANP